MNILNLPLLPAPLPDGPMPGALLVGSGDAMLLIGAALVLACALLRLVSSSALSVPRRRNARGRRGRVLLHRV